MIYSLILDPEIIDEEKIASKFSAYENFRRSLNKNLILIYDKEKKLKNNLKNKILKLSNKPSLNKKKNLFSETILNLNRDKKEYVSNVLWKDNLDDFAISVKNSNKHLLAYVTENNGSIKEISLDRKYNDAFNILEKISIESFDKSKLYITALKNERGPSKKIDELNDSEFNFFMENLLWNTREVNFIDNTFGETVTKHKSDNTRWNINSFHKNTRTKSLEAIGKIIKDCSKVGGKKILNIYTIVPESVEKIKQLKLPLFEQSFREYKEKINSILPDNDSFIEYKIHLKSGSKVKKNNSQIQHVRLMEVNSTIINTDLGTDFIDNKGSRKHCRFSYYPFQEDVDLIKNLDYFE
jgi:hypothetical protein